MRIIILTSSQNRSGGTRQAMYQARELSARGHDVSFCLQEDSSLWELDHDATWIPLPCNQRHWKAAVEQLFTKNTPTILHAYHNKAVKFAAWHGLFWRKQGIVCCAHRGVMYRPNNPLPYLSPGMAGFIANSKACSNILSIYAPASKRFVVYNGVEDARITPHIDSNEVRARLGLPQETNSLLLDPKAEQQNDKNQERPLLFGFVGTDTHVKGVDILIEAFAKAQVPNAHLLLVGVRASLWEKRCKQLDIANRVHIVPQTEHVADLLQIMDVFVLPSRTESLPNTMLEAIRMGLPVIGSHVGGVPELVQGNGLTVPAENSSALAKALTYAYTHPKERQVWAQTSRQEAQKYTMTARVDALEQIYSTLMKQRGYTYA